MSTPMNIITKQPFLTMALILLLVLTVLYAKSAIQSYYWYRYLSKPWWQRRATQVRHKTAWNWPDE